MARIFIKTVMQLICRFISASKLSFRETGMGERQQAVVSQCTLVGPTLVR